MHCSNAVQAWVTDDPNNPVWTSFIFFRVWKCASLSDLPLGKITMLSSEKEKSSPSYFHTPKKKKNKYQVDEEKCVQNWDIS